MLASERFGRLAGSRLSTLAWRLMPAALAHAPSAPCLHSSRALSSTVADSDAGPLAGRRLVAVGLSGGVDSAVAAMLLKQQGHEVVGVFMRNWDEAEETGNSNCSVERDARDARAVAAMLRIPLHEADFVAAYWTEVFTPFLGEVARGLTPNPDLPCNRHIKFDALVSFVRGLGADLVATGHYARLRAGPDGAPQLLRGVDRGKDQSYFLASVDPTAFQHVAFPLGGLLKADVRQLAADSALPPADRRSSAGICFIGRRRFGEFVSQYVPPLPGRYVDVQRGAPLPRPCPNLLALTHGQRAGLGGAADRVYVVGKDLVERVAWVATGRDHPALLTRSALLRPPHWLSAPHAARLAQGEALQLQYKARYGQQPAAATLSALPEAAAAAAGGPFQASAYTRLLPQDEPPAAGCLVARFAAPAHAITPAQAFVMYDGDLCLGSAPIAAPGRTLHEEASAAEGGAERQAAAAS